MCGRFSLANTSDLEERFGIKPGRNIAPRYNIAPSQKIMALVHGQGGYDLVWFVWGLIPFWSKDPATGKGIINARAETVDTKASFKHSFRSKRCLIPADGFYEWKKEGNSKKPYRFTLQSGGLFTFAGLWEEWNSPQGTIRSCAIITTGANDVLQAVHNRMPVIVPADEEAVWLGPGTDTDTLKSILKPYPGSLLEGYEISTLINSPHNDRAEVLQPIGNGI